MLVSCVGCRRGVTKRCSAHRQLTHVPAEKRAGPVGSEVTLVADKWGQREWGRCKSSCFDGLDTQKTAWAFWGKWHADPDYPKYCPNP